MAPASNSDPSSPYYRHYVMQTLGYTPVLWEEGEGIGDEWKGFSDPKSFAASVEQDIIDYTALYEGEGEFDFYFGYDWVFRFPECSIGHAKLLFQYITQFYSDWRLVGCNNGLDGSTPVFSVGKSKAEPYRWTGYFAKTKERY